MDNRAHIIQGDSRRMAEIAAGSIDLALTSPPYWQIKDYGAAVQIGYGQSLHQYLFDLARVWHECFRVLRPGRRLCVNIGDQFARTSVYGRYKVIPLHSEVISMAEAIGFDYMGSIIWQKKTTMNTSGGGVIMGSFPHPPNGIVELDYEHILLFKKPGESTKVERAVKDASALTKDEWKTYFAGHWNFGGARQVGHEAMFPEELPRRLIRMFSFAGETVLDPFMGSGTTAKVALDLGRNVVGYEIQSGFIPLIRDRLTPPQTSFDSRQVTFTQATPGEPTAAPALYRPHVEDATPVADAEEDRAKREKEPLCKVIDVIDESTLRLDSGSSVSLLGVSIPAHCRNEARNYLSRFVQGKKVFVRHDDTAHTNGGPLPAYVLLSNKIFINRKMIEMGLAKADRTCQYRHRAKFIEAEAKECRYKRSRYRTRSCNTCSTASRQSSRNT